MHIRRLRYFIAVAQIGSITSAARRLHVAQPAVSNRIRQLEADLGATLFDRRGSGATLTKAGSVFLPHAVAAVEAFERGRKAVANFSLTASLAIGCTPTLGMLLMPKIIAEYRRRLEPAQIATLQGTGTDLVDDLRSGKLDVVLCYEADFDPDLTITPLFQHDILLIGKPGLSIAAPDGTINFRDIGEVPLALDPRNRVSRKRINEAADAVGIELKIFAEVEPVNAKAEFLLHHGCYSLVPRPLFGEYIATGALTVYQFRDVQLTLEAKCILRKNDSELFQPLLKIVKQIVKQTMDRSNGDMRQPGQALLVLNPPASTRRTDR